MSAHEFWHPFFIHVKNNRMSKENRGAPVNPSEQGSPSSKPQQSQKRKEPKEGEYRNIETPVNNTSYFGDDFEVRQEEEIAREEVKSEDENNVPDRRRRDK
jgi:hypothetical protein